MKFYKLYVCILSLSYFLSGCVGELGCNSQQARLGIFTVPSLYSIVNPKDTFHINDTLWVRFQVPDTFSSYGAACNIIGNTLTLHSGCFILYTNNADTFITAKSVSYTMGTQTGNNWDLQKSGSYYVVQFGLLIDNRNIIGIGAVGDTVITNTSVNIYPCRYPASSGCPSYSNGFYLNTTFQNGLAIYPLIVR